MPGLMGNVVLNGGWSESQTQNTNPEGTLKAKMRFVSKVDNLSLIHDLYVVLRNVFYDYITRLIGTLFPCKFEFLIHIDKPYGHS